jgi:hypothetical protein
MRSIGCGWKLRYALIVLPLNICAIPENLLYRVAASRSLAKQSPDLRGDCFGGRTPPRNDTQYGCGWKLRYAFINSRENF